MNMSYLLASIFWFFSSISLAAPCAGTSIGLNFGNQNFHRSSTVTVALPNDLGTYTNSSSQATNLQAADVEADTAIGCASFNNGGFPKLGLLFVLDAQQTHGTIASAFGSGNVSLTSQALSSGPKLCLEFASGTNVCGAALVSAVHLKVGDAYQTDIGSLSPAVSVEQVFLQNWLVRATASYGSTSMDSKYLSSNAKTETYTAGIAYLVGNPTGT